MAGRGYAAKVARGMGAWAVGVLGAVFAIATRSRVLQSLIMSALVGAVLAVGSPAQAASETYSPGGTGIARDHNGQYSTAGFGVVSFASFATPSYVFSDTVFYATFNIPANRQYTSASLSHVFNGGIGNTAYISLISSRPAVDDSGRSAIRAGTPVGSVTASFTGSGGTTSLANAVVAEMNRLSAAGGGVLYLGGFLSDGGGNQYGNFSAFNLVGEFTVPAPTISSISPNSGPTSGGATVTISGSNLNDASGVTFGGTAATIIGTPTAISVTVSAPARAAGAVDVVVTTPGGTVTATNGYTYRAPPTITGLSPSSGTTAGDTVVTISGTNLGGVTGVTFGGTPGQIVFTPTDTSVMVQTRAHPAGVVDMVLTTPGGTATASYTYSLAPTVYAFSPDRGSPRGNQTINISGVGFTGVTAVTFGGAAASFVVLDSNRIRATTPPHVSGRVEVVVTSPEGSWSGVDRFWYDDAPALAADFAITPLAYNTGTASSTAISLAPYVNGTVTRYELNNGGSGAGSITTAHGGRVSVNAATGQVDYTPPVGFRGNDSFQYRAGDRGVMSDWATVTVPVNNPVFTVTLPASTGQVTVNYNPSNTPVIISGGQGPYTVTAATGYPRALDFNAATGVLAGRVTIDGNWTVNFTITDSSTGAGPYTATASAPLVTTQPPPPVGSDFTASAVAYNTGAATPATIELSGHVTGVVLNYALNSGGIGRYSITTDQGGTATVDTNTGRVSYTPPVGFRGSDSFQYGGFNSGGFGGMWSTVTIPVSDPVFTVTLPETTGQIGVQYNIPNAPVTISGGQGPYTVTAVTGYPRELEFNTATQVLSGWVRQDGTYPVVFTITDSSTGDGPATSTASATLITTFPPLPAVTAFTAPGVAYNRGSASATAIDVKPYASGVVGSYYLFDGLDTALTVATAQGGSATIDFITGLVSYTAPVGFRGADSFRYFVGNAFGPSNIATITVPVGDPTFVVTLPETAGTVGVPYNSGGAVVTVTGGAAPYSNFSATGLPAGLTISSAGVISGTPTTAGAATVVVTVTDSSGGAAYTSTASASVNIAAPTIVLSPASGGLAQGVGGSAYGQILTSTGGIEPIRFEVTVGALPPGLNLSTTGFITGTPTASGTFNFTVTATDSSGNSYSGSAAYSITVVAPTINLNPAAGALPGGLRTVAYSQTFSATGGTGPYSYVVTDGALPAGLTLTAEGGLSGTPTAAGSHGFEVTATDANGFTGATAYTLEVGTPIAVVQAKTVTVVGGQSVTIDASEGATGLELQSAQVATNPAHGVVSANGLILTYTAEGSYAGPDSFTYTVTNPGGVSAPATVSITVNPAVRPGPEKTVTVLAGQTAVVELTEGAFGAPFTGATVVSVSPSDAGVARIVPRTGEGGQQLYDLSFEPDDAFTGEATVLYTLNNAFATSAPGTVVVTVEARPDPTADAEVSGLVTAQNEAARRFATAQIGNVNRRLQQLRSGGRAGGGFSSSLSLSAGIERMGGGMPEHIEELRELRNRIDGLGGAADELAGFERSMSGLRAGQAGDPRRALDDVRRAQGDWGVWVSGAATFGRADQGEQREGFRFNTDGLTIGLDRRIGETLAVGAAMGWATDRSRIGENGTRSDADAWSVSLYGGWQPVEKAYVDVVLGYGRLDFDSRRFVTANGEFADGRRDGDQWFGAVTAGWDYRRPEGLSLSPYGRIEASRSVLGAFTERGGGLYALSYDEQAARIVTGAVGLNGDRTFETDLGLAMPSFRLEYSYDFQGTGAQRIRYADWLDGNVYSLDGRPLDRDRLRIGLGLDLLRDNGLRLGLDYEGMLSGDQTSSTVRFTLETPF